MAIQSRLKLTQTKLSRFLLLGLLSTWSLLPSVAQSETCRVWVPISVDDISFIIPAWVEAADNTGVCLDVSSPVDGSTVTGDLSNVTIVGTVGDGVDDTSLKINTTAVTVTSNTFSHAVSVTEGSNTVTLEVADTNGATFERTLNFTYNVLHKVEGVSGPTTLGSTNGSVSLSWTAPTSGVNGIDHYEIEHELNGVLQSSPPNETSPNFSTSGLANGTHRFRVRACNAAGCGAFSDWVTIVVSQTPALVDLPTGRVAPSETGGTAAGDAHLGETFNGIVAGSHDVTGSGAATYRIPLAVPPGTQGMQPSLSLNYSSQRGSGLLGDGWSVGGVNSAITRCGKNLIQDSTVHAVNYTSEDYFCLNGQRLILEDAVNDTYGSDGVEYRTLIDSFSRITSYDTDNDDVPEYFTVETKGRQTLYFGDWSTVGTQADDARIEAEGTSTAALWLLSRAEDASSNYLDYVYEVDGDQTDYRPKTIEYAGNVGKSLSPYAKVAFSYENKPVTIDKYRAGSTSTSKKRLTSIKTFIDSDNTNGIESDEWVRDVRLTYDTNATNIGVESRNHLISIQQCVPDGLDVGTADDCSETTSLDWVAAKSDYDNSTWTATAPGTGLQKWADLNGDGRMDYITSVGSSEDHYVSLANSSATGYDTALLPWEAHVAGDSGFETFTDLNGDGKADYLTTANNGTHYWSVSTGSGYTNTTKTGSSITSGDQQHLLDLNADGLVDYLLISGSTYTVYLNNNGTGYQSSQNWTGGPNLSTATYNLHDANGDGFPDVVVIDSTTPTNHSVYLNNGSGFDSAVTWTANTGSTTGGYWSDPNGDGLLDYITISGTSHIISFSTGTGYDHATWAGAQAVKQVNSNDIIEFKDMNGDGLIDFVTFDNQHQHYISFSDGAGYQNRTWSWNSSGTYYDSSSTGIYDFIDLDGDGKTDFATVNTNGQQYVSISRCAPIHLMNKVTDGLGVETTFTYQPLTDTSVYTKGTSADYPEVDVINATHVVSEMTHSNPTHDTGDDDLLSASYTYEGFKIHRTGYGSLGFSQSTVVDNDRNTKAISEYNQSYPFIGTVSQSEVRQTSSNRVLAESDFTYKEKTSAGTSGATSVFVETQTQKLYDPEDGRHLSTTTTTNLLADRDGYGNSTKTTVSVVDKENSDEEHKRTTTRTIVVNGSDVTNWFIGEVDTVVVKNEIINGAVVTWLSDKDRTTDFEYDSKGRLKKTIREKNAGAPLELTVTRFYDDDSVAGYGNLIKEEISGPGITTRDEQVTYDTTRGQYPATLTNAEGHVTTLEYDDRFGVVDKITDLNGLITTRDYDNFGRLIGEDRPDGTEASVDYIKITASTPTGIDDRPEAKIYTQANEYDNQITPTLAATPVRIFYDAQGREVRRRVKGFDGTVIHVDTEYDSRGRVLRSSQPYYVGETVHWNTPDYDDFNRVVGVVAADETQNRTTVYDGFTVISKDALGPILGRETIQTRNAIGQVIKMEDEFGNSVIYEYDQVGNLSKVRKMTGTPQTLANEVTNTYDRLGRKTSTTDPDAGIIDFTYNALSELTEQATPRLTSASRKLTLSYDKLGRLISRTEPHIDGSGNIHASDTLTSSWSYDDATGNNLGKGKLHQEKLEQTVNLITTTPFTRTYTYDSTVTNNAAGQLSNTETVIADSGNHTYDIDLHYDTAGRVSNVVYPTSPSYSAAPFEVEYRYNARGYLERVVDAANTSIVFYQATDVDAEGRITGQYLGDGSLNTRGYAPGSSRLTYSNAALDDSNSKFEVQNQSYTYDGVGNLKTRSDLLQGVIETFDYDALDRLTKSTVNDGTTTTVTDLAYNALGNIEYKSDFSDMALGAYTYGTGNVINTADAGNHAVTGIDTDGIPGTEISYTYDDNGNQLTGDGKTLTWTSYDKPATIAKGGATRTFYYGSDRARYRQDHSDGTTTHYVGDLYEKVKNGGSEDHRHIIYANGQAVAIHTDDEVTTTNSVATEYLHRDHLGSITTITDNTTGASSLPERMSYDAFGQRRDATDWVGTGTSTEVRGYTGHEHLDDVGIIHMNGRVYDPKLGRMLSPDPIVQSPLDGQNWNRYSYVLNNSLRYTDPSGYATFYLGAVIVSYTQNITEFFGTNQQRQAKINDYINAGTPSHDNGNAILFLDRRDELFKLVGFSVFRTVCTFDYCFPQIDSYIWHEIYITDHITSIEKPEDIMDPVVDTGPGNTDNPNNPPDDVPPIGDGDVPAPTPTPTKPTPTSPTLVTSAGSVADQIRDFSDFIVNERGGIGGTLWDWLGGSDVANAAADALDGDFTGAAVNAGTALFKPVKVLSKLRRFGGDVTNRPVFEVSRTKTPEIAENIDNAIKQGKPSTLTRIKDRAEIRKNRRDALRGQEAAGSGQSLDEFPFACTSQGGTGACVKRVPVGEQNSQGGQLSQFFQRNNVKDGDDFDVKVVD